MAMLMLSGRVGGRPPSQGSFQLAEGHWVPAKLSATIIYPRPDAETSSVAVHRNAHPGMPYAAPVVVRGGAYPFKFEITSGPSGATIGDLHEAQGGVAANYGVFRWDNPTVSGSPHTVTVRVTDQDGTQVSVTWTIAVGTTPFLFVDPVGGNDSTGDGSEGSPYLTLAPLAGQTTKIAVLRDGADYMAAALTEGSSSYALSTFTRGIIAYPGDSPRITFGDGGGRFVLNTGDCFLGGVTFNENDTTMGLSEGNTHFFLSFNSNDDRATWFDCSFTNADFSGGTSGANCAGVWFTYVSPYREYIAFSGCTFDQFSGGGNGGGPFLTYAVDEFVFERNVMTNVSADFAVRTKANTQNYSIRDNVAVDSCSAQRFWDLRDLTDGGGGTEYGGPGEWCYNKGVHATGDAMVSNWGGSGNNPNTRYVYRNTMEGDIADLNTGPVESQNNVFTDDMSGLSNWTSTDDASGVSSSDIDADGLLAGATRTSYLGTRGAEIA